MANDDNGRASDIPNCARMTSPLQTVAWGESLLEPTRDRDLERFARQQLGIVPPLVRYLAPRPWVPRALVSWTYENGLLVDVDPHLADLVALVVSQEASCRYCYAVTRSVMRLRGFDEQRMHQIEQRLRDVDFDPRTAAAINFARLLARAAPLPDARTIETLREQGYSRLAVNELAFIVASTVYSNRLATMIAISPYTVESLPDRWYLKLLQPLIQRLLKPKAGLAHNAATAPDGRGAPFAVLPGAFAGSPIASRLSVSLDEMHASNTLPPRCKALMFAVVAHALGCDVSAENALRMLQASDHRMDAGRVKDLLAHLGSPELDAREKLLTEFARETIWYTPRQIQLRARALRDSLTPEQFVEVVGITAFANAVCRLTAAVVEAQP